MKPNKFNNAIYNPFVSATDSVDGAPWQSGIDLYDYAIVHIAAGLATQDMIHRDITRKACEIAEALLDERAQRRPQ